MDPVSVEGKIGASIDEVDLAVESVPFRPTAIDAGAYAAPRSSTESGVARIWTAVLGQDVARIDVSFLDCGGDSLSAMQVLTRVRDAFRVRIHPADFFASPTILHQARMIDAALAAENTEREAQLLAGPL